MFCARSSTSSKVSIMAEEIRKLFVARLPWTACRVALREYFGQFGAVERSQVLFDQNTGRSKRFGFVVFKEKESIDKTMKVPRHEIHDTEIFVQAHKPPKNKDKNKTDKDPLDMMIGTEQK